MNFLLLLGLICTRMVDKFGEEVNVDTPLGKLTASGPHVSSIILISLIAIGMSYINWNGFNEIKSALSQNTKEHWSMLRSSEIISCINFLERKKPETLDALAINYSDEKLRLHCPWILGRYKGERE